MDWYKITVKEKHQMEGKPNQFWLAVERKADLVSLLKKQGFEEKHLDFEKQKHPPFDSKKPKLDPKRDLDGVGGLSSQVFDEKPNLVSDEKTKKTVSEIMKLRDKANTILEDTDTKTKTKTKGETDAKRKVK